MSAEPKRRTGALGYALIGAGLLVAVLLYLQPWVSCEGEDSSAGCPVPAELEVIVYIGWALAALAVVAGVVLVRRAGAARR